MKRYLKDMETKEQVEIIMNNEDLKCEEADDYYEQLMQQQCDEADLMLGEKWSNYIEYRDNYNSFFFILRDWYKFIDNLDSDYLNSKGLDLYKEIIPLKDKYDNVEMYSDEYYDLENRLEEKCKDLLKVCEKQLQEYETYTDEDLKEHITFDIEENNFTEDLYILNDDKTKVYKDIAYTKTYE